MLSSTFVRLALLLPLLQNVAFGVAHPRQRALRLNDLAIQGLDADGSPRTDIPDFAESADADHKRPRPSKKIAKAEYVDLPIDHDGKIKQTYKNRYWVNTDSYKPGGPVFLFDGGEGDLSPSVDFYLYNSTSFFKQMLDQYHGIGIGWEHRYYGDSLPFPVNLDTPTSDFQYLTTAQALSDIPAFAAQFKRDGINHDLTPKGSPWVMVGGSYPGMRSAFMREEHPDTIFASWASSAPVQARRDMSIYFDPIPKGMQAFGYGNCTADIISAVSYIDKSLANKKSAAALKVQFLGRDADKNSNAVFGDAMQSIFWLWQAYAMGGGPSGLGAFCDYIETDPVTKKTAPAQGWAKTKGAKYVVDRWAKWPTFAPIVSQYFETKCEGSSRSGAAPECNLNKRFDSPDTISWTWQYCSEWGFLQSANLGSNQIVSKYSSLRHQHDICHRQFVDSTAPQYLPDWPRTAATNAKHGGWSIRPSNVYWSGGQFDPWRTLSPLSDEPFAPKVQMTQTVPKSGQKTAPGQIFAYVSDLACHCWDFRTYFKGGQTSRDLFHKALDKWLPEFRPGGYGS